MKDATPLPSTQDIDPFLSEQLQKLGIHSGTVPERDVFMRLIARISQHYRHLREEKQLLTRSLELSNEEMMQLYQMRELERDRLAALIAAIGDALGLFEELSASSDLAAPQREQVSQKMDRAKLTFSSRVGEIVFAGQNKQPQMNQIESQVLRLADRLLVLMSETAQRATLRKELEVARAVQQLLMPPQDVLECPGATIAGYLRPAAECAGDWWTVHKLMDERVLVVVGDVTGHGASSAIITGVAKASCDLALSVLGAQLTCENLLEMMNDAIWKAAREKVTMTCVASLIDAGQRRLNVASAGHPVPYCVRRREGDCDLRKVVTNGAPLGTASSAGLHTVSAPLEPGDLLLWYSDGLVDCENRAREMFSEKRLRAAIKDGYSLGAVGLRDRIVRDVQQFCGDERPIDDITLVVASVA